MRIAHWVRSLLPIAIALVAIAAIMTLPDRGLDIGERPQVDGYRGRIVAVIPRTDVPDDPFVMPSFDPFEEFDPDATLPPLEFLPDDFAPEEPDYQVQMLEGPRSGEVVGAYLGTSSTATAVDDFAVGDEVVVSFIGQDDGTAFITVSDRYRVPVLGILLAVFVVAVLLVGRGQGFRALVALGLTVALVLKVVIPEVLTGTAPVPLALAVASIVTVATIGLTEGFRRPGIAAILGTICALAIVGISSAIVTEAARFSASGSDDLLFLWSALGGTLDIRGLLLAAIILGALGVLDDVTVTQAVTVEELAAGSDLRGRALWSSALRVGRSHIGATVNTLFLAYVGASLPLVVLFVYAGRPATLVLNDEVVAIEVVRTLCGGLGIVAAVPITTAIATLLVGRARDRHRTDADVWAMPGDPSGLRSEVVVLPRASTDPRPRSGPGATRSG
jgi:uncharacterized membrane protein